MNETDRAYEVVPCPGGVHWAVVGTNGRFASYHRSEHEARDVSEQRRRDATQALVITDAQEDRDA